MTKALTIRAARAEEAGQLSGLALRSKAHWGYDAAFIEACRDELSVDGSRFGDDGYTCVVAESCGAIIGFYALVRLSGKECELDALFVEPASIGTGVGRSLVRHAIGKAVALGFARMIIQGDPHAGAFYVAAGATPTGRRESGSIPGRFLPLFEIGLG